jgi:hypothetical protein
MNDPNRELLRAQWLSIAAELGIECIVPVVIDTVSGGRFEFACLLTQFGSTRGMLVDVEAGYIEAAREAARIGGFGLSTMAPESNLILRAADFIECIVDWGWAAEGKHPSDWYSKAVANAV